MIRPLTIKPSRDDLPLHDPHWQVVYCVRYRGADGEHVTRLFTARRRATDYADHVHAGGGQATVHASPVTWAPLDEVDVPGFSTPSPAA
jgi:hypothetical protein